MMKKKLLKFALLLFAVIISLPAMAQEYIIQDTIIQPNFHYVLVKKRVKLPFTPSHEFRLSIGAFNAAPHSLSGYYYHDGFYDNASDFSNSGYEQLLIYSNGGVSSGAISARYSYNVLRWLSVGASFTYAGFYYNDYDRITGDVLGTRNINNYMFMPVARFTYLDRPFVRLYSQVGLGIGYEHITTTGDIYNKSKNNNGPFLTGQFTAFGVSVGRQLFGFVEFGWGGQGSIIFGIGYKFNDKKAK